jgi:hypothetical protein
MHITNSEQFLNAMYELYKSVEHIGCVSMDDYIEFFLNGIVADLKKVNPEYAKERRNFYETYFRRSPVFIFFNDTELMNEVNRYIEKKEGKGGCDSNMRRDREQVSKHNKESDTEDSCSSK